MFRPTWFLNNNGIFTKRISKHYTTCIYNTGFSKLSPYNCVKIGRATARSLG